MSNIRVEVPESLKPNKFSNVKRNWTVLNAEERIRKEHGLEDGTLQVNDGPFDDDLLTIASQIQEGDVLSFVNGTPRVQLQQQNQSSSIAAGFVSNEDLQHQISLLGHELTNRLPKVIDTIISPSEFAKSSHNDVFKEVLDICGFGNARLIDRVETDLTPLNIANRSILIDWDYSYNFMNNQEKDCYTPLLTFLSGKDIYVQNVTNGEGLIEGLLFEQELWTLKKDIRLKSNQLGPFEQCLCKFILRGRTDFVRLNIPKRGVTRINNQYFIEIKKGTIGETELKEAFYQLLGGNAGNSYRSPPVLITNLALSHYILFISLIENGNLPYYQLNIFQFPSFGQAIIYLEDETKTIKSCTRDFLRKPTPLSSPLKSQIDDEELAEFEKISIEPVFNDENFEEKSKDQDSEIK